jgi:hypothetical protein
MNIIHKCLTRAEPYHYFRSDQYYQVQITKHYLNKFYLIAFANDAKL